MDAGPDRVAYEELHARVSAVLRCDLAPGVVQLAASALVDGQALGNSRFGLALLGLLEPGVAPVGPRVVEQYGGRVVLDGAGCFGPLAIAEGARLLGELVREHGIAVIAVRSLAGFGRLAPYVEAVARGGALALAGAASSPAVAPHGGHAPFVGTNPLAVGLPALEGEPLVLDIASSAATMAEVHRARDEGDDLREGVAVDASGAPTRDPAALNAVLPRGGLLGMLVGMVVEGLTAGVTGEPSHNGARTVTLIAVEAAPDGGGDLRRRLLDAGGREPTARARAAVLAARRDGLRLDEVARSALTRLER
jgi:LDH2 family malate/lactate/ureidoglycolate dehydrogenase